MFWVRGLSPETLDPKGPGALTIYSILKLDNNSLMMLDDNLCDITVRPISIGLK